MSTIPDSEKRIKCLVWDLDWTLWSGILLEGDPLVLRPGVRETVKELDQRGILQSIASQNDPELAAKVLDAQGLRNFFVHPQMSLTADKPYQITTIANLLNLQLEHVAFIDDDPTQRAYVAYALPPVTVLQAAQAPTLAQMSMFAVTHQTEEARRRREFYQAEIQRQTAESGWSGRRSDFLHHCQIRLILRPAALKDVARIAELVERTNQLNTAALRFTRADVRGQISSPDYQLTIAQLSDRFGDYGTVGVVVIHEQGQEWTIEVLLVSCRVMGRGVGEALLCHGLQQARARGQRAVHALYRGTAYNRAMHMLFVTHGFKRDHEQHGLLTFTHDLEFVPDFPPWLDVQIA